SRTEDVETDELVRIIVEYPSNKSDDQVVDAIQTIFLSKSEQLADVAPSYWQWYLRGGLPASDSDTLNGRKVFRVAGGVSAPRVEQAPDPASWEAGGRAKFEGAVVLRGVVAPDGWLKNIVIQSPVGLGLDEKAVEVAQKWRFDPAMKDGNAVPVAISIEVNLH